MDLLEEYMPAVLSFYSKYYVPYARYIWPLQRYLYIAQAYAFKYAYPITYPLYRLLSPLFARVLSGDPPDLATYFILAVVAFATLKLMDMLRRQVMYWISIMLRLLMWVSIALLGVYVYYRGVEQTIEDCGTVYGFLAGLEEQGERIGQRKGRQKMGAARRVETQAQRARTGWY